MYWFSHSTDTAITVSGLALADAGDLARAWLVFSCRARWCTDSRVPAGRFRGSSSLPQHGQQVGGAIRGGLAALGHRDPGLVPRNASSTQVSQAAAAAAMQDITCPLLSRRQGAGLDSEPGPASGNLARLPLVAARDLRVALIVTWYDQYHPRGIRRHLGNARPRAAGRGQRHRAPAPKDGRVDDFEDLPELERSVGNRQSGSCSDGGGRI